MPRGASLAVTFLLNYFWNIQVLIRLASMGHEISLEMPSVVNPGWGTELRVANQFR